MAAGHGPRQGRRAMTERGRPRECRVRSLGARTASPTQTHQSQDYFSASTPDSDEGPPCPSTTALALAHSVLRVVGPIQFPPSAQPAPSGLSPIRRGSSALRCPGARSLRPWGTTLGTKGEATSLAAANQEIRKTRRARPTKVTRTARRSPIRCPTRLPRHGGSSRRTDWARWARPAGEAEAAAVARPRQIPRCSMGRAVGSCQAGRCHRGWGIGREPRTVVLRGETKPNPGIPARLSDALSAASRSQTTSAPLEQ